MALSASDTDKYPRAMAYVDASGNPVLVSAATPLPTGGAYFAEASFTPAASSHTAGDVNGAGAQTFALGMPAGSTILIHTVSIRIDGSAPEATGWLLYLFDVTPPSALADLGDFLLAAADRAAFLGRIDLGTALDLGDTQFLQTHNVNAQFKLHAAGTGLFGYLVNGTTVTPAAVAHVVRIHGKAI